MTQIAVLTGGESPERQVALWSADYVVSELKRVGYAVDVFDLPSDLDLFLERRNAFSCVVPVLHGKGGEDGTIQGFLETLKIPYVFSGVEAHAVAMDKAVTKRLVSAQGILTPNAYVLNKGDAASFKEPCVVKPIDGGSTLGTTVVEQESDFARALHDGFRVSSTLLVESLVVGTEYTIPVVEEGGVARALEVIEVDVPNVFSFEDKYAEGNEAIEICPARIDEERKQTLQALALQVHKTIGARHFTRTDVIVDQGGNAWFLEINTIPGMTSRSLTNKALAVEGKAFGELLHGWIASVLQNHEPLLS